MAAIALLVWLWMRRGGDDEAAAPNAATPSPAQAHRAKATAATDELSGRVTRASDGAPIAGAQIAVFIADQIVRATSAPDGRWRVPAHGIVIVAIAAPGYLPQHHDDVFAPTTVDVALVAGGTTISGTVADANGGPIGEAHVATDTGFTAITDGNGHYELTLPDGRHDLAASHDDYEPESKTIIVSGAALEISFALLPGGTLTGTVVDATSGAPLADMVVEADDATDTTGPDGRFALHGLKPAPIDVDAHGPGHALVMPLRIAMGLGEQRDARIAVGPALAIAGRVEDMHGVAVAAAYVFARMNRRWRSVVSDRDGSFRIEGLLPGGYELIVSSKDLLRQPPQRVDVVATDVTNVRLVTTRGTTIKGRVDPPMSAKLSGAALGESDAQGTFTLTNARVGTYELDAEAHGYAGKLVVTVGSDGLSGVVIAMNRLATIRGSVLDEDGAPVAGAFIAATGAGGNSATTDRNGRFVVTDLQAGMVVLTPSFEYERWTDEGAKGTVKLELHAGEVREGVALTLARRRGRITGIVRGPDGPAPNARVVARLELGEESDRMGEFGRTSPPVLSGPDGAFAIAALGPGAYHVMATAPGGELVGHVSHVPVDGTAAIALVAQRYVDVSVVPATHYQLSCRKNGTFALRIEISVATSDGHYRLGPLEPGTYNCTATTPDGYATGETGVTTNTSLVMRVDAYTRITGTAIHALSGAPLAGLEPHDYANARVARTDATGRFVVEHALPGRRWFDLLDIDGQALCSAQYDAAPGEAKDIGQVRCAPPRTGQAGRFGMYLDRTLKVTLDSDGPASTAGLRDGDVVTAIDGASVADLDGQARLQLFEHATAGTTYRFTLQRGPTIAVTAEPVFGEY